MTLDVRILSGAALDAALPDVARLRISVFRAWPYLYDGDLAYERGYLSIYSKKEDAVLVGAFDGARLVGAATGTPLEDHAADFGAAFEGAEIALEDVFYCAESVLLPEYRGLGVGHRFFDAREGKARALGRAYVAFCAVVRPQDHPLRPDDARSLEPFWRGRGYAPMPGIIAQFGWRDLDQTSDTQKPLQFWIKRL